MTFEEHKNPLLFEKNDPEADLTRLESPTVMKRAKRNIKREIRDSRRAKTAADAIGQLDKEIEVFGFTKGQFSILDVLTHCLSQTGKAQLSLSTWTAASAEISAVLDFVNSGLVTESRWLVDLTFNRRSPQLAQRIRQVFGDNSIRVARNHAKFFTLKADGWKIVCTTSMNLNFNPRFENFCISHDPELFDFHEAILDEVWHKQDRSVQDDMRPFDIHKHFENDL